MYFDILPIKMCNLYLTPLTLGELVTSLINWEWQKWRYIVLEITHKTPYIFLPFPWGSSSGRIQLHARSRARQSVAATRSFPRRSSADRWHLFRPDKWTILVQPRGPLRWLQSQLVCDWNHTRDLKQKPFSDSFLTKRWTKHDCFELCRVTGDTVIVVGTPFVFTCRCGREKGKRSRWGHDVAFYILTTVWLWVENKKTT